MKKYILILIFSPFLIFSQKLELKSLRELYCSKNCNKYKNEQIWIKQNNPPKGPQGKIYPKLKRLFSIPLEKRMKLYPFNQYDSIYVANPVYLKNINEPRNYMDEKYHNEKRLLSKIEKDKISDILFNYYYLNSFGVISGFREEIGYDCIQFQYPKIILLFKRNGKFEKYIAFPDNGLKRYNFSNQEWSDFDWSMEKEDMILEIFKKDILPDQNCKTEVYTPPPAIK